MQNQATPRITGTYRDHNDDDSDDHYNQRMRADSRENDFDGFEHYFQDKSNDSEYRKGDNYECKIDDDISI